MLPSELLSRTTRTERLFLEYWLLKTEEDMIEKHWYILNRSLGTVWERSDFEKKQKKAEYTPKVRDRVWYPLSLLLAQSDIRKEIQKDFTDGGQTIGGGEYVPSKGEEVVNLGETTTKEEFLDFIRKFGPGLPGVSGV